MLTKEFHKYLIKYSNDHQFSEKEIYFVVQARLISRCISTRKSFDEKITFELNLSASGSGLLATDSGSWHTVPQLGAHSVWLKDTVSFTARRQWLLSHYDVRVE